MKYVGVQTICALITLIITAFLLLLNTVEGQDACSQRADTGTCRGSFPRYFYDARSGRCETFLYGGCGGNRNNFENLGSCNSFRSFCLRRSRG